MQGVQPSPNSTPSSGAPAIPARGRTDGLMIRPANENRSSRPANSRPRTIVSAPSTSVTARWWVRSAVPKLPNATPYEVYSAENPSTNSAVPATTRPRGGRASTADGASAGPALASWAPGGAPTGRAPEAAPTSRALSDSGLSDPGVSDSAPAPDMPVT